MFKRVAKQKEMNDLQMNAPDLASKYKEAADALDDSKQSIEERYKKELLTMQVQSEQTKLANSFKQILVSLSDILVPIVKIIMITVNWLAKAIKPITLALSLLSNIFDLVGDISTGFKNVGQIWEDIVTKMKNGWTWLGFAMIGFFLLFRMNLTTMMMAPFRATLTGMGNLARKMLPNIMGGGNIFGKMKMPSASKSQTGFLDGIIKSIKKLDYKQMIAVGVGLVLFASALWILAKAGQEFNSVNWSSLVKMGAILGFLTLMLEPFAIAFDVFATTITAAAIPLLIAAGILGAFSIVMMGFGFAAKLAGQGIEYAARGLTELANVGFSKLLGLSAGLYSLSGAMISFGAAMAGGGIMSLLGGGMMLQLLGLAAISPLLIKTSDAINDITENLTTFKDKEIVTGINAVTSAIKKMNDEIEKTSTLKLMAMTSLNKSATSLENSKNSSSDTSNQKLDELVTLLKNGAIAINLDGNRVSYFMAKNSRERGGLGAIA
jgi:hypothetical protein